MNRILPKLLRSSTLLTLLLFIFHATFAQQTVTGTVTDENAEVIPGANIFAQGTTKGTTSDINGKYSIIVPGNAVLVFSFLGYKTVEEPVGNRSTIDIQLGTDARLLEDVVVVGYGTVRKSDVTGALASVSAKDFEKQPLTKIDQALQGRAAGVQVNQTSGAPGSGFKIRIRGSNSISGNNDPLYVVDGLVVGSITSLNVNDIASMEVLKDASATAIYGSRGANGVVLITTKTGKKGAPKIELGLFTSVARVAQKLDVMTPAEFAEGVNFAEGREFYTPAEITALRSGGGENWQERFFRPARSNNAQLSISGGSDAIDYFISGNLYDTEGTIIDQDYKRYTLRANLNAKLTNKLKVGLNTNVSHEKATGTRANLAAGLTWDPTTPAFNADGDYNFIPLKPGVGNGAINPLVGPQNGIRENFDNRLILSGYANYDLAKGLVLNISGGLDRLESNDNGYTPLILDNNAEAVVTDRQVTRLQNTNRLTYTYDPNINHSIKIDAIHEQQLVTRQFNQSTATGFFSDQTTYKNLSLGAIQRTDNNFTDERLQSFLGRVNYSLLDRFLFTATVRADGSSKFRDGNRWGVFPSGSVAWRLSEEKFIQDIAAVSNLKVRASYGVIGSQAIGPLATRAIPIISPNVNYPFTGGTNTVGVAPSNRLANPDLTWETTTQRNLGIDFGSL